MANSRITYQKKQLLSLATGELAACGAFLFAYIALRENLGLGGFSLALLLLLIFMLLQGSSYWLIKRGQLGRRARVIRAHRVASVFAVLRTLNIFLLAGTPLLVYALSSAAGSIELLLGAGIYLFAWLEYINYYWYRLSYGRSGFNLFLLARAGLQPSSIHRMLMRAKRVTDGGGDTG